MASSIEWLNGGETWNPIRARLKERYTGNVANPLPVPVAKGKIGWMCVKISPGCERCYAEQQNVTCGTNPGRNGTGLRYAVDKLPLVELFLDEKTILAPLHWKKPRLVFPCSMTDWQADFVPDEWRDKMLAVMALTPQHTYLTLTKRADRQRKYLSDPQTPFRIVKAIDKMVFQQRAIKVAYAIQVWAEDKNYFVDNQGNVFTTHGSGHCVWCGKVFAHGQQDSRFCSHLCASASGYARSKGGNPEPAGGIMRKVKQEEGEQGHRRVWLIGGKRELVHRMVLTTFNRPPVAGEQACHGDGDPSNCHISNLRWGTQQDNWKDRIKHGNHQSYRKLSFEDAKEIKRRAGTGEDYTQLAAEFGVSDVQIGNIAHGKHWSVTPDLAWPLPGLWLGTSAENQEYAAKRIPLLLQTPAAVRWISAEPLLAPIDLRRLVVARKYAGPHASVPLRTLNALEIAWQCSYCGEYFSGGLQKFCPSCNKEGGWSGSHIFNPPGRQVGSGINWLVAGGESGPGARPMHPDWARSLRDQCQAAGVPFFFKQWGEWVSPDQFSCDGWDDVEMNSNGISVYPEGRVTNEWGIASDGSERVWKVGKKAAGRLLDGREHSEYPA